MTGGPTDEARGILNLRIQYWTSRGWAFVNVNYGGSSGMYTCALLFCRSFRSFNIIVQFSHWNVLIMVL